MRKSPHYRSGFYLKENYSFPKGKRFVCPLSLPLRDNGR